MTEPLAEGAPIASGYEVTEHLGRSGLYDVYDVWSEERDCRCVAKCVRPDRADERRTRRRLLDEGARLAALTHPHIVRAYETIEFPHPVVILETLTGATLAHMIESSPRRLPAAHIAWLGVHVCSALHYLHRHELLHLDLKPSNIVSDRGYAKLLDLSVARPPGDASQGIGTPQYMAPEQARGGRLDYAADVWGLGVVLWEAAVGRRAFDSTSERYEQLDRRAIPVRRERRLPASLAATIDACLDPHAGARPRVGDVAATLDELVED